MTAPRFGLAVRRSPPILLSLAAGGLTALSFPPFGFLPGLLGYGLLMRLADAQPLARGLETRDPDAPPAAPGLLARLLRRDARSQGSGARRLSEAFWRGWLAGFVYFLVSTWWVAEAFLVDAKDQGWMAPMAVALLAGLLALFWGGACLLYRLFQPRGALRPLVFAGCFCLLEWLRGHVFTGFPWDLAGEAWRAGSAPSQAAALVGAYGLGWITVAVAAAPAVLPGAIRLPRAWLAVGLAALTLAGLYAYGADRLAHAPPVSPSAPIVRVVQAQVKQVDKYDMALFEDIVRRYVTLTAQPTTRADHRPPDVVIWPEGAVPDSANAYLADGTWTKAAIRGALTPGQTLLAGAYRVAGTPDQPLYFNTLLALRAQGRDLAVTGVYDKYRLVPFGEYMPLDSLMERLGVKALTHTGQSFSAGPRSAPLDSPGLPRFQPLICYESLYPGFTRDGARRGGRSAWIVNVSNDAWFGRTYGPAQHLNLASYRAIEEGLPIVRATPTGISAVIDAFGRIAPGDRLDQDAYGVIDAALPPALAATPFSRHGESLFWLMIAVSALAAAAGQRRQADLRL